MRWQVFRQSVQCAGFAERCAVELVAAQALGCLKMQHCVAPQLSEEDPRGLFGSECRLFDGVGI